MPPQITPAPVFTVIDVNDKKEMSDDLSLPDDSNFLGELRRAIRDKYVNAVGTFILVSIGIYLATVAAFHRNILHPLTEDEALIPTVGSGDTVVSLFVLMLASLALGWVFSIVKVPALFGALLMGVAFRNIPLLSETFTVDARWEYVIRLLALACIIIRWGVGLDTNELKKRPILPITVGILSPIAEAAVITIAAHFIFGLHLSTAVICGFLMAAVSPAVTVPVMLELRKKDRGAANGIPTSVLAASSVDNLFCIGAFSATVSLVFSDQPASLAIMWSVFQIIIGIVGGLFIGWLLWWFPLPSENTSPRILVLASAASAAVVGCSVVNWATTGIIAAIIFCSLAATRWRQEENSNVKRLEESFATVWNLVCLPLLFALIGRKLVFDELSSTAVWAALALIGLGAIARLASAFILSMCSLSPSESLFVALSMIPKATVQAALAPGLLSFVVDFPLLSDDLRQVVTCCVITILVTAPLGQLLLIVMGGVLLEKEPLALDGIKTPTYTFETPLKTAEPKTNGFTKQMFIGRDDDRVEFRM